MGTKTVHGTAGKIVMASATLMLDSTADFDKALSYALGAIGKDQVKLKNEQELAIRHICLRSSMYFCGCQPVSGKVSATNAFHFFLILSLVEWEILVGVALCWLFPL